MELALGPAMAPLPSSLLERTREALDDDSALLSFQLGDRISWLWALDREGLALYALPARAEVESQSQAAAKAIREDAAAGGDETARLWRTLFGQLAPRFHRRTRWLVALDRGSTLSDSQSRFTAGGLPFEAPLAALQDSSRQPAAYLAERHVIEIIPGAGYWLEAHSRTREAPARLFVGLGDPIYNTADPRLAPPAPGAGPALKARPVAAPAGGKRRGTRRLCTKLAGGTGAIEGRRRFAKQPGRTVAAGIRRWFTWRRTSWNRRSGRLTD